MQEKASLLKLEKDIKRSLQNLKVFSKEVQSSLPAFYYSADLLIRYAQQIQPQEPNAQYFIQFNKEIQILSKIDFPHIKRHQKDIVNEILDIVNSQLFIESMRPDIRASRSISRIESFREINEDFSEQKIFSSKTNKKSYHKQKESAETASLKQESKEQEAMWEKLLQAYKQHRIDEANDLKNQYKQKKFKTSKQQDQLFSTIELEYKTMMDFYVQFDLEGWQFDKEENGVTLQYKMYEEEKQMAMRIESQFDIPIQNFLAILCQMDLFGDYVPFCYDSKQLKVVSRNEKIGSSKVYLPLLTDRETYFYAAGYDRYKHNGSIFLYSKTINSDYVYQDKYDYHIPQKSDYVRLEYKFFIVEYRPITRQKGKVRIASKVDMKLNFLPNFVINASTRKFAFNYFKNIIKVNKKFSGSKWQQKIKQNSDFYMFFKRKIDEYLA